MTDEEKGVEIDKGAHQEDGFEWLWTKGGCGGNIDPMTVLDPQCKYIPFTSFSLKSREFVFFFPAKQSLDILSQDS